MKVGVIAPLTIAAVSGGVRTQVMQTSSHLKDLGVEVQFISTWDDSIDVDLVHVFGAGPDTLGIIKSVKSLGIKTVLSPVFFSTRSASAISLSLKAEKFLSMFGAGIRSDFGIKADACNSVDLVLPNTLEEAHLIIKGFGVPASKVHVVPNGVETRFMDATPDLFVEKYGLKDFVLFAGQAGAPRKNVIKLLEAAKELDAPIVIIGSFYEDQYGQKCRFLAEEAGDVTLIETLQHDSELLASAYAACHTFVLPSFYETPGIAAMEAALTGANVVITQHGGTKEYFGTDAEYLDPGSITSVAAAIKNSLVRNKNEALKTRIFENYTWDRVAEKTLKQYQLVI